MRALMSLSIRSVMLAASVALAMLALGCGHQIGDACIVSTDCSPQGDRLCDISMREGYCTIQGCDYSTCPSEAACIRFFTGSFDNKACTAQADCSLDELCDLEGKCVPRSSEIRYCMRKCDQNSDCRDGYECRDLAKMILHGGEPVLAPGLTVDSSAPKFCAPAPG
jgi:hypothetical protein